MIAVNYGFLFGLFLLATANTVYGQENSGESCVSPPPEPILKETIGDQSESSSYINGAVQIIDSGVHIETGNDFVKFVVNQVWNADGIPMLSVGYPGVAQGDFVCESPIDTPVEYDTTLEYTAQCFHGYADVSVYIYVGDSDIIFEECETCSASDPNFVGYYLTLPCDEICSSSPTNAPTEILATPTESPTSDHTCPESIEVVKVIGETDFPEEEVIQIVSQDTSTVTVSLINAWADSDDPNIDNIFVNFKKSVYSEDCYESTDVEPGAMFEEEMVVTCNALSQHAIFEICVADDIGDGVLSTGDNASVPRCCHPSFPPEKPVVCYVISIQCVCQESDATSERKLSPSVRRSLRVGARQ